MDKMVYLDITSLEVCSDDMLADIRKAVPLMSDYTPKTDKTANSQVFRTYVERSLRQHPVVAQNLDLIIAMREPTELGLPIEVYFFLTDKVWAEYETIQSDIFDHLHSMAPEFGLRLYQYPQ